MIKKLFKGFIKQLILLVVITPLFLVSLTQSPSKFLIELDSNHLLEAIALHKDNYKEASDVLLRKQTYLFRDFTNYSYEDSDIWYTLDSTYNLYINSLYDVHYLATLYEETGELRFLERSKEILTDWLEYYDSPNSQDNKFIIYDHSVSKRSLVLINFLLLRDEKTEYLYTNGLANKLEEILTEHGEWLYDDKNYPLGNHALMMDRSLLVLAIYKDKEEWFQKSIRRIEKRIKTDFTKEGVHLENSPDYHVMVMDYYYELKEFLEYYSLEEHLSNSTQRIMQKMPNYLTYITMPNRVIPPIGDSGKSSNSNFYKNEEYRYLLTDGREGIQPKKNFMYFPDAGVATYRESWIRAEIDENVWWTIKSGAKSPVHKHDDDLSFLLYASGNELFTDAGKYNYEEDTPFRKYVRSPLGHNTISINNQSYEGERNLGEIELLKLVEFNNKYIWLQGQNRAYVKTILVRDFIFLKPNTILIIDRGKSPHENSYTQSYLFGPDVTEVQLNKNSISANTEDGLASIELNQYETIDNSKKYYADDESGKGYVSEDFNEKTPIHYVEFSTTGNEVIYLTTIQINKDDYKNTINSVKIDSNVATIKINNQDYNFELEELELE